MEMGSICEDCMNRLHCMIDSSANVQRCAMYNKQPDFSKTFDKIAEKIADRVVEKLRGSQTNE